MTAPDEYDVYDEVTRAARITARRWPGVIDSEDAEQEIWVRLLESDYLDRLAEMDSAARTHVLGRIGGQVASRYRDDYEAFSGNLSYGTDEVRAMLRAGLLARQRRELDPSSETLTEFLDLHEGAQSLRDGSPQYAETIHKVFLEGGTVDHRMQVTRAVDALTREMNRVSSRRFALHADGPGTRTVLSNAQAHYVTSKNNDGFEGSSSTNFQ